MKTLRYWRDFFSFLKNPCYFYNPANLAEKIWVSVSIFILMILFALIIVVFVFVLPHFNPETRIQNIETLKTSLIVAIFAGVFEELVYRLPLVKFNTTYLSFSFSGLVFIAVKKIWFHTMLLETGGLLPSICIALTSLPFFYLLIKKNEPAFNQFWEKHFPFIFYCSAVLFAVSHFFNGRALELINLKANITHFVTALFLGYLRIRTGLIFAMLIHIIWDLIL